jgi:hypothetical protein
MQWVPYPRQIPQHCWFMRTVNGADGLGYIEGDEVDGLRAYISVEAVRQIATQMGWAPVADGEDRRLPLLREQVAAKDAEIADLRAQLDAVGVLQRAGALPAGSKAPAAQSPRPRKAAAAR